MKFQEELSAPVLDEIMNQLQATNPGVLMGDTSTSTTTSRGSSPPPDDDDEEDEPALPNPRPGPSGDQYFESQRVFALLIGIDSYDLQGNNLAGCVKDSLQIEKYLREETENSSERLHLMTLHSPLEGHESSTLELEAPAPASRQEGQPTRQGIIDAFQNFLTQANEGDTVLVHYSGHGSFETRPEELWHLDGEESSKHRAETLMCKDSFTKDKSGEFIPALRDKEIRWLLSKVAEKNPHVLLLMDCCNAAGNTRFNEDGTATRFNKSVGNRNGIDSYVFYQEDAMARSVLTDNPTAFSLPEGRHVAFYAGHSYQLAKEREFDEGRFGVFSYFLLQTLRATKGNVSYRDLLKIVRNKAVQTVADQSPQWYATQAADLDLVFLGGAAADSSPAYTVLPTSEANQARLDAGSLHGLLGPNMGQTFFTVFAADQDITALSPDNTRQAELISIAPDHSILEFADGNGFPEGAEMLKAIIKASPLTLTKVCVELEVDELSVKLEDLTDEALRERMQTAKQDLEQIINDSKYLKLVDKSAGGWKYRVFIYRFNGEDKLRIAEKDSPSARIAPLVGWSDRSLKTLIVTNMNQIAKWERTLALENPQPVILQPGLIELQAIPFDPRAIQDPNFVLEVITDHGGEITLKAKPTKEEDFPALKFKVQLKKPHDQPLFCAVLHLNDNFGVSTKLLAPGTHLGVFEYDEGGTRIKYDETEVYVGSNTVDQGTTSPKGMYLNFIPPPTTGDFEVKERVHYMKLMVSTEEFSPDYLYQKDLDIAIVHRMGRTEAPVNQLESMFQNIHVRDDGFISFAAAPPPKISDWWTSTIRIVVK